MEIFKRTPENAFNEIENFDYNIDFVSGLVDLSNDYKDFRLAYINENIDGQKGTLLCLHGHPTWSYLWRHLIPIAKKYDYRILALDLPGFGQSDKPLNEDFFTFNNYRNILINFINHLNIKNITLVLHEWGGTLGLTLPMEKPEVYSGIICFNTYMSNNIISLSPNYLNWIDTNIKNYDLNIRALMARTNRILNLGECNAYEAPFPDSSYKLAIRKLPSIFPINETSDGYEIFKSENWWRDNRVKNLLVLLRSIDSMDKMKR